MLVQLFESDALLSAGVQMMRSRLRCHVNIGPLKDDPNAVAETKLRLSLFTDSVGQLRDGATASQDDATIDHVAQH